MLAAILFPVFATAREKARQSSCASNMKQMALAMTQYTQDYDDCHVPAYTVNWNWQQLTLPYIKTSNVFVCPDYVLPIGAYSANQDATGTNNTYYYASYGINFNTFIGYSAIQISQIPRPDQLIEICDSARDNPSTGNPAIRVTFNNNIPTDNFGSIPTARHSGGENFAFVDGHVKWYFNQAIWSREGLPTESRV